MKARTKYDFSFEDYSCIHMIRNFRKVGRRVSSKTTSSVWFRPLLACALHASLIWLVVLWNVSGKQGHSWSVLNNVSAALDLAMSAVLHGSLHRNRPGNVSAEPFKMRRWWDGTDIMEQLPWRYRHGILLTKKDKSLSRSGMCHGNRIRAAISNHWAIRRPTFLYLLTKRKRRIEQITMCHHIPED